MENAIRILIVEDEFTTIDNLIDSLEEVGYEIEGFAMTAEKALKILDKGTTDLVILDIQLKEEKTGIWLGEQIKNIYKIPFIYLSAFSDISTVKAAAKTSPASYLIKPFITADIYAAVEIALSNFPKTYPSPATDEAPENFSNQLVINENIFVRQGSIFKKIRIKDIFFIHAFKNYLELTSENNNYTIRHTLQDFLKMLPNKDFIQTHRSYVVNINHIETIDQQSIILKHHQIPISATYKDRVMKQLKFFY